MVKAMTLYFVATVCLECKALHLWKIHPVRYYPCLVSIVIGSTFLWDCFLIKNYSKDCKFSSSRIRRMLIGSSRCTVLKLLIDYLPSFCNWNEPHMSIHSDKCTLVSAAICEVTCMRTMAASVQSIYMWIYEQEWKAFQTGTVILLLHTLCCQICSEIE